MGIGAGAFILLLVVLIIIPSSPTESPAYKQASNDYATAHIHYQNKRFDQARGLLAKIPAEIGRASCRERV